MIPNLPILAVNKKINCDFGQKSWVTNEALLGNAWAEHNSHKFRQSTTPENLIMCSDGIVPFVNMFLSLI